MSLYFGQDCVIELLDRNYVDLVSIDASLFGNPRFARGAFGEISMALFRRTIHTDHQNEQNTVQLVAVKTVSSAEPHDLREIQCLRDIGSQHSNIISLLAVYPSSTGNHEIKIVTEYCPVDLYMSLEWRRRRRRHAIAQQPLSLSTIQCIMYDLFNALQYMHTKLRMIHNDIKPGNLLISSDGYMKICDFGLVQPISTSTTLSESSEPSRQRKGMTTLNYRSPEVLFGETCHLPSMDMYATGVILVELLLLPSSATTLFHGTTELEQVQQICTVLGTPNANHWPEYLSLPYGQHFTFQQIYPPRDVTELIPRCCEDETNDGFSDLLRHVFVMDPKSRYTSSEAFQHTWFHNIQEQERQRRLLVQDELIPTELVEPVIIVGGPESNRNTVVAQMQALELAAKRRSFLIDLDQWLSPQVVSEGKKTKSEA